MYVHMFLKMRKRSMRLLEKRRLEIAASNYELKKDDAVRQAYRFKR